MKALVVGFVLVASVPLVADRLPILRCRMSFQGQDHLSKLEDIVESIDELRVTGHDAP